MTAGGPYYAPLADLEFDQALRALDAHLLVPLRIGQHAVGQVRPGGSLLFMSGTGVVEPTDVAALAVHLMANTAVTGATYDIDGGEQLV